MTGITVRKANASRVGVTAWDAVGGRSRAPRSRERPPTTPGQRAWLAMCGMAAVFGATVLAWAAVLVLPPGLVATAAGLVLLAAAGAVAIGVRVRPRTVDRGEP